jgi:protein-L-isoaspartate O-methyltransferase
VSSQRALFDQLTAAGKVSPAWASSVAAVDRGAFVPDRCWVTEFQESLRPLDRSVRPGAWEAAVYSDVPIVTQLDNGLTVWPACGHRVTGSVAQPTAALGMLDLLDVEDECNVLEIGTSSGYATALLADRLGANRVTSLELDDEFAGQACEALDALGYEADVIWADGEQGWAARAPYDRIISAASILAGQFPMAWLEQVSSDGRILTPWKTLWGGKALVRLTARGGAAQGPVISDSFFVDTRTRLLIDKEASRFVQLAAEATDATHTMTSVRPDDIAFNIDCSFAIGLRTDNIQHTIVRSGEGTYELLAYDVETESWANVRCTPDHSAAGEFQVRQQGSRQLWAEIEKAYIWWIQNGRPVRSRFGLTIMARAQTVWLDHPRNLIALVP